MSNVAVTPEGVPGTVGAAGVTGAVAAEGAPVPIRLVAVTVNVNERPLGRPVTVHEVVGAVAVRHGGNGSGGGGLINVGPVPTTAAAVEAAVAAGSGAAEAAAQADAGIEVTGDLNASEEFRRHLTRVLVQRALEKALA